MTVGHEGSPSKAPRTSGLPPGTRWSSARPPNRRTVSALAALSDVLIAAAISFLLVPVVAWITLLGRGYMAPLGFALAMMALGNVFAKTGWAAWFPWSIVPMLVGMVGKPASGLPLGSYVVVAVTFVGGIAAAIAQFTYADNVQ